MGTASSGLNHFASVYVPTGMRFQIRGFGRTPGRSLTQTHFNIISAKGANGFYR